MSDFDALKSICNIFDGLDEIPEGAQDDYDWLTALNSIRQIAVEALVGRVTIPSAVQGAFDRNKE